MNDYAKALQQYKEQSVNTMTPAEMLHLLYDELIKRLKRAKILLENKSFEPFEKEIARCQEIVAYLDNSLNPEIPISKELTRLYDFFSYQLIRLTAGRNTSVIDETLPLIVELRDTFVQADQLSRTKR